MERSRLKNIFLKHPLYCYPEQQRNTRNVERYGTGKARAPAAASSGSLRELREDKEKRARVTGLPWKQQAQTSGAIDLEI